MADRDTLFQSLSHEIRQSVVKMLSESPRTYTYLLETLDVQSGHLAYHLRQMEGITYKDEKGFYHLTPLGWEAYRFLVDEEDPSEPPSPKAITSFVVLMVVVLFIGGVFNTYYQDSLKAEREEALLLSCIESKDCLIEIIYEIFNEEYIARATWTDMLLSLVQLSDDLTELNELSELDYSHEVEMLEACVDEFTEVVKIRDDDFPISTIEHRPQIRELHTLLVELGWEDVNRTG